MPEWLQQLLFLQTGYRGTGAMGNQLPARPPAAQVTVSRPTGTRAPVVRPAPVRPASATSEQDVQDYIRLQLLAKQSQIPLPSFSNDVTLTQRNRLIGRLVQNASR